MCELFGFSSRDTCDISGYLKTFYTHSNMHPHGWGLACMEGTEAVIEKEPIQASKSNYLKERLSVPVLPGRHSHISGMRPSAISNIRTAIHTAKRTGRDGAGRWRITAQFLNIPHWINM